MKKIRKIGFGIGLVAIMALTSCESRKNVVYFQQDQTVLDASYVINAPKLKAGDILMISVTGEDPKTVAPFNQMSMYNQGTSNATTSSYLPTYTVDKKGEIWFPKLGKVQVAGLTRLQAVRKMEGLLSEYIKTPGVQMKLKNFKVTVLGEVKAPSQYTIDGDRVTVLEALAMAGDLTINGVRNNVLVIREIDGVKTEYRMDLTKRESLNSPAYYLSQNDVVYVEPNNAKVQSSKYSSNYPLFISIAGIIITIISVLTR
ncbi:MAG: polysaccharide biosynthesis/export family protein [Flavobacteriaceae bacterium]|jgi:polysaccharide export outer membrane protein|nr:polysaccharide biosynthesis/export family protein [Flavobacteriaceae bacterium]